MASGISSWLWITMNTILTVIILTGGFFMFRAFLRRMKREQEEETQSQNRG